MYFLSYICFYFCANIIMPGKTPTTPPDVKKTKPRKPDAPGRPKRRSRNGSRSPRRKTPRKLSFNGGKKSRKRKR